MKLVDLLSWINEERRDKQKEKPLTKGARKDGLVEASEAKALYKLNMNANCTICFPLEITQIKLKSVVVEEIICRFSSERLFWTFR